MLRSIIAVDRAICPPLRLTSNFMTRWTRDDGVDTGALSAPVATREWYTPESATVEDDQLRVTPFAWYDATDSLRKAKRRVGGPGMLEQFTRLGDGKPVEVAAFVERWGSLDICRHLLPTTHPRRLRLDDNSDHEVFACDCDLQPIGGYQVWATLLRSALRIAVRLGVGQRGDDEDWTIVLTTAGPIPFALDRVDDQAAALATLVSHWMELADVRPALTSLGKPTFKVEFFTHGAFGGLMLQLLFSMTGAGGFATCSVCGNPFTPNRQPAAGRHAYCEECKETGAAQKFAVTETRRRKRKDKEEGNE